MVVGVVAVAAPGPLDVLDGGVRGFGAGVGDPGGDEYLDGRPPGVQCVPQPTGLGGVGGVHPVFEAGLGLTGGVEDDGLQDESEAFFDAPGGGEFAGGVVGSEDFSRSQRHAASP